MYVRIPSPVLEVDPRGGALDLPVPVSDTVLTDRDMSSPWWFNSISAPPIKHISYTTPSDHGSGGQVVSETLY